LLLTIANEVIDPMLGLSLVAFSVGADINPRSRNVVWPPRQALGLQRSSLLARTLTSSQWSAVSGLGVQLIGTAFFRFIKPDVQGGAICQQS